MGNLTTLRTHSGLAAVTVHVELHAVAYDLPGNIAANGSEKAFDGCRSKLSDGAALDADRVVVMLYSREAVLRSAVHHGQLADDPGLQEQLDRSVDRRSADGRKFIANLLYRETLFLALEKIDDGPSWSCRAVSLVFKDRHEIGT